MSILKGISHLTFSVSNLAVSMAFYQQVFDADLLFHDERTAYFDLAGLWLALNVQTDIARQEIRQSYTHTAFQVDAADMAAMEQRLLDLGVALVPGRSRTAGEGLSLYFTDPDGHLLEVHAGNRETRLDAYQAHENISSAEK